MGFNLKTGEAYHRYILVVTDITNMYNVVRMSISFLYMKTTYLANSNLIFRNISDPVIYQQVIQVVC